MRCAHAAAVPVESNVTGEILAALCPACDAQLPAEFLMCPHEDIIDTPALSQRPGLGICNDCGTSAWYGGQPTALVTLGPEMASEDLERFRERFLAAQHGPHRTLWLPYVATLSAPTAGEIT